MQVCIWDGISSPFELYIAHVYDSQDHRTSIMTIDVPQESEGWRKDAVQLIVLTGVSP